MPEVVEFSALARGALRNAFREYFAPLVILVRWCRRVVRVPALLEQAERKSLELRKSQELELEKIESVESLSQQVVVELQQLKARLSSMSEDQRQEVPEALTGLKQFGDNSLDDTIRWADVARRYPENTRLFGNVTNITDDGAFVEIVEGVEGLVHVSEMDWTNKNTNPSNVVSVGDEVEVMVLEIDNERRRISLGMKQCKPNPWQEFAQNHQRNDRVSGQIKLITDFTIFVGLPGNIYGLVDLSDLSWNESGDEAVHQYQKGMEVEAVVLSIDSEQERISLGIKQLTHDPLADFVAANAKGSVVSGTIVSVDSRGASVNLDNDVSGYIRASDTARDWVDYARTVLTAGEAVEAYFVGVDRKNRTISLSIRAKEEQEEHDPPVSG